MENVLSRLCGETIRVRIVLAPRIHPVRVDAAQVEQIVMTLVANAIDAMPMGGEITIETSDAELGAGGDSRNERVVPGDYAMLAVTDSGAGMDEATMARLFEPFFTTKGPGRGMGLGLASAHGIVQQNGGYIWAHSEPGRGTTMKVFFPRDRSIRSEGIPSSPAESFQEGSGTILVVEGDSAVRGVAERILAVAGYTVLTASNGAEAAEICKRESAIDLLLTDVVLPGKGGPALVDELVRNRPDLPVLYMSGYTQNTILRYGPLGRAAHLICKPFTAADLTAKVREILDAERS
jgi:CheY-like chemotaxis protein